MYLLEEGEDSIHKYAKYMSYAVRIFKELNLDVKGSVLSKRLPNTGGLRYGLPKDCVKILRVGICDGGYFKPLGLQPELCVIDVKDDCGNLAVYDVNDYDLTESAAIEDVYWFENFAHGEFTGGRYGQKGGQSESGYYRIDYATGELIVASLAEGASVIIEYLSNGINDDGDIFVLPTVEEALIAGVRWLSVRSKPRTSMWQVRDARSEYYNQKRLARARSTEFNKELALQYARRGYQSAPKL